MIDLQLIREKKDHIISQLYKRGIKDAKTQIHNIALLDEQTKDIKAQYDQIAAKINQLSKTIGAMIKSKVSQESILALKAKINHYKAQLKQLNTQLHKQKTALFKALCVLPNLAHESVPEGKSMQDNLIVYQTSPLPKVMDKPLAHWDLVKKYDLVDFEWGNKITGAGFTVYKGKGAKLQRALIHFFLEKAIEAGYVEVQPPILVNQASTYGTGQFPDKESQMYYINTDQLYVIPTAEVPITNIYRDCIIKEDILPIKHVGYTPCFRREVGSWGAQVRGLNRLHQFDKVELVQICHPLHSYQNLEEMLNYVRGLVEQLALPYRIVKLCTGDLGFCAAMTYDIEVFSIGQQQWLEVSSLSNFETFQANRLALRYKDSRRKSHLLHTLNGSALALPRVLAALLELYQTQQGILVPDVLQPYTGFALID